MISRGRARGSVLSTTAGWIRLAMLLMAVPAVIAGLLAGVVVALGAGALSLLGLIARQPRAPWRAASGQWHAWLTRAAGLTA